MALGQWYRALKIAEKRAPQGDVAMTEIMLVSQALLEAVARVAELEAENARLHDELHAIKYEIMERKEEPKPQPAFEDRLADDTIPF